MTVKEDGTLSEHDQDIERLRTELAAAEARRASSTDDQHVEQMGVVTGGDPEPGAIAPAADATETFDTQPGAAQTIAEEAEKNARLRAELAAANAALEEALAQSRQSLAGIPVGDGLTDEDVRRLENPHEFIVNLDELEERVTALEAKVGVDAKATA
jgi:uncharacterized membrane protein YccC